MSQPIASSTLTGPWDVIVVGAGPAGSAAACASANLGLRTLLLEKATFPRDKVCGGCLSPSGVQCLRDLGAIDAVRPLSTPIEAFRLLARGRVLDFDLSGKGLAIGRESLDHALLIHAQNLGVMVQQGTSATLLESGDSGCRVRLLKAGISTETSAHAVVVADGLAGSFLPKEPDWASTVASGSRFGVGSRIPAGILDSCTPGKTISMHCSGFGYLGLIRLQDGTIDAAAALDPARTKSLGGPGPAIASILRESGIDVPPAFARLSWHGTPLLTRRRRVEAPGIFIAGDAAAYVEPFTGEGMSWALRGGMAVAEHARMQGLGQYRPGAWTASWSSMTGQRRWACRAIAAALRAPRLVSLAMAAIEHVPSLNGIAKSVVAGPWHSNAKAVQSA